MLGELLDGRYQVTQVLEAGGFGQTYLAQDTRRPGNPQCVVKQLKPTQNDPSYLATAKRLFIQEAEILEKIGHHSNIPTLLAYFDLQDQFYLVQEYIEGRSLKYEITVGHPWTEIQIIHLLQEILPILEFIHHQGVIHRDLKPENLIRRIRDGKLFLIDFGSVKTIQGTLTQQPDGNQTVAIGTTGYIAPEQAQGRPLPCSDLYSVGMLVIQALTGNKPLKIQHDLNWEKNWYQSLLIEPDLLSIIQKLVCYQHQQRYQSATEVLADLKQITPKQMINSSLKGNTWFQNVTKILKTPVTELFVPKTAILSPVIFPDPSMGETIDNQVTAPLTEAPVDILPPTATITDAHNYEPLTQEHIFISYRYQEPDLTLAREIEQSLIIAGYQPFLAAQNAQSGFEVTQRIHQELQNCDYFLLLLSEVAAASEMVTEEVRQVKNRHDQNINHKPIIIPIRVNLPSNKPLNYELRGYLNRIKQREWRSQEDTPTLISDIIKLIANKADTEPQEDSSLPTVPPIEESSDQRPLPAAEPVIPEGQVDIASAFYIERYPVELRCYETILKPGSLIRIKAPRQMGKTSLMARILHHASSHNLRVVSLSFQLADSKVFNDLDRFLRWFCASITRRLRLPNRINDYWDDLFGSKENCTTYFEEYILPEIKTPLVLGLDEVDLVFDYSNIAEDFFGLLRAWHEEAKNRAIWQKLHLVVVHATEVYVRLNINQSPFNVGLPIELREFKAEQVQTLAQLHQLNWQDTEINSLMAMVGGHPYLVRLALYHLSKEDFDLETLLSNAITEAGLYSDHLRRHWWILKQHPELAVAFREVLAGSIHCEQIEPNIIFKLHSMGLVTLQGNQVQPRCQLYQQYFSDRLISLSPSQILPSVSPRGDKPSLAAIVFTDAVDSTASMISNQTQMLRLLKRDIQLMSAICQQYEGKVLKSTGDGLLMYFTSAIKAVACAQEIQRELRETSKILPPSEIVQHRIGIHLGDVFFDGDDVLGAGVNIAARLQTKAQPGTICISQTVYEVVKNHLHLNCSYLGNQQLKGIPELIPLYLIEL